MACLRLVTTAEEQAAACCLVTEQVDAFSVGCLVRELYTLEYPSLEPPEFDDKVRSRAGAAAAAASHLLAPADTQAWPACLSEGLSTASDCC